MNKMLTRVLCGIMVAVLLVGFLAMLIPSNAADTIDYRYGPGNVIYNWGERGEDATSLSPNAIAFYNSNGVTYEELADLSGSATVSSVPSSALYKKLQNLMASNHDHETSYNETRDLYQYTDCMNNGLDTTLGAKISSFYSGIGIGPSWDSGSTWNREHTWPNSKGDASGNGENDIIMLRPTATNENGSRGNKAYGETAGTSFYDPNTKSNGTYNLHGDVARVMLYVYVRWGNTGNMWGASGVMESREVLLKWLAEDPVDTWEMGRNDSVESITGTRNVFVDYPELAFKLLGEDVPADLATPSNGTGTGTAPTPPAPVVVPETVTQPVAGTGYKLFMHQASLNSVLFFNGQTESETVTYRLAATTNAADAVEVYLENTTGGYHLYFMDGNQKTYIRIYERTDGEAGKGKGSLEFVTEAPAEVLTYDSAANTLVYTADDGENSYYLGTYSTYSTFSVSNTSYITGNNAANVDESQFPARFADASFQGSGTGGTITPPVTPDEPDEPDVPEDTGAYTKISTIDQLTSGEYVMIVSSGFAPGVVDGTWITAVEPTVSGNTVTNSKGGVWTLYVEGNTVTLQDANGVYVGPKGGNYNGIKTGTPYQWEVSCQNGEFTFKGTGEDTVALASNADPEYANKFRGYKTTTITDAAKYPSAFTLYKGDGSGTVTPPPVEPDEPVVPDITPSYTLEQVTNPVAGTAYKLYMHKTGEGKTLFFNGLTESETVTYRLATTTDPQEAVDVYLETVADGYRLYFMNDGVKTYIRVYERTDDEAGLGKGSLEFVTEAPAEVLIYDSAANTLVYTPDADNAYYMGTYSTFTTFSVSNTSYITGDNAANVDVTQYPARFALVTQEEELPPVEPIIKNGWVFENGSWYFYENGNMVKNDWRKDSIGWCYLLADGKMAVNKWQRDSKGWCYVGADGYCVTNAWKRDSIGWCYLNAEGRMATNAWVRDSVGWCYVGADGYCVTNAWKRDSVGWCYLDAQGRMVVNKWILDGGKWYYLDANGYMLANTSRYIGGKTYRFNASGVCTNP